MAKVLFVTQPMPQEELGVMNLSASLKKDGHETLLCQIENENIRDYISSFRPDFVAWHLRTGTHRKSLEANTELKKKFDFISIIGGPHCTFFPDNYNEEGVDFQVRGPGEDAISKIVNGEDVDPYALQPFPDDPDDFPIADRELVYRYPQLRNNPMKNIISLRGCPHNCTYCHNKRLKELYRDQLSQVLRRRSVGNIIEEIQQIKDAYPLEQIMFLDDHFLIYPDWIEEFCYRYPREVSLPFIINIRVDNLTEDDVRKLKSAGLSGVICALESASPDVRRNLLNRGRFSNETLQRSVPWFKKHDIRVRVLNMIGLPLSDPLEDAKKTLKFNKELEPTESNVHIFQPFPGTPLGQYSEDHGFIPPGAMNKCLIENFFYSSSLKFPDSDLIAHLSKWWHSIARFKLDNKIIDVLSQIPISAEATEYLVECRFKVSARDFYRLGNKAPQRPSYISVDASELSDVSKIYLNHLKEKYALPEEFCKLVTNMPTANSFIKRLYNRLK